MTYTRTGALLIVLLAWSCISPRLSAMEDVPEGGGLHLTIRSEDRDVPAWEQAYLRRALDRLYSGCSTKVPYDPGKTTHSSPNQLSLITGPDSRRVVQAIGGSSAPFTQMAFLEFDGDDAFRYEDCQPAHALPVVGIMEATGLQLASGERRRSAGLTSYEPNRIGWRFDDDDVKEGYLDATVSLKYPFLHDGYYSNKNFDGGLYFAFTGRFSQYIESRDSAPVISKRFTPKIFWRYWLGDDSRYIDLGVAHESNGQNINSEEAYLRARADFILEGQDPEFARDYISRGWDYLSLDWKHGFEYSHGHLDTYVKLKHFLDNGPFQGEPEEYNDWEGDGVQRRRQYDGIGFLAKYEFGKSFCLGGEALRDADGWVLDVCLEKVSWEYTSGYEEMFENDTNRLEFTVDLWSFPLMFWGQTGYNSDLTDYYRKVDSWGITLELQSTSTLVW